MVLTDSSPFVYLSVPTISPIDLWIFLSKVIPSKILFVLSYPLQIVEALSVNYILKAMIIRVGVPPFVAHL